MQLITTQLAHGRPLFLLLYVGLIVFFAFFYTAIVFNPTETAENLGAAVRTVNKGGRWFSNEVGALIARLAVDPRLAAVDPLDRLSQRQRTILQLIAEGRTNKEMAVALHISESTVDSHRTQLMRRLDVHDIASLVRVAYQEGIIEIE